jgi:glycosyltransferase involved in cell wall biosynthesis
MVRKVDEKIKVCFVSPFAYSLFTPEADLKFGGAEVQMYLLANELAKDEDFDVNFVVLDLGQKRKEEYNGVKVHKAYKRGRSFLNLIRAPLKLIATLFKICPDVVISRAAGVEVGFSCLYTKFFSKEFIYSIACDKDVDKSFFQGLRGRIFKFGLENADYYIAQSQKQVDILERTYNREFNNIQVIPNGFYLGNKDSDSKEFILWVGSSMGLKRPEIFADLAEKFPEERLVMIMAKSKAAPEKWKEIEQRVKDIENLELIEQVPFQEIDDYFAKSKVFVSTSTAEGFPNTFLQAMIVKTPILSLNVDPDGFIEKTKCGFSCEDSVEELQEKLKQLLENKEMRERMGKNGYGYITKNHDINKNIQEWKQVIKKI